MDMHIYAPAGYFHIQHNNCLAWFDLTGWHEPTPILWRKKYERIKKFRKRCHKYVVIERKCKFMTHKQGGKILMKNIKRENRILDEQISKELK